MIRIGIDIGGTFTDFVVWRDTPGDVDSVHTFKLPSTPPQFHRAVLDGLKQLVAQNVIDTSDEIVLVHGTTVSTNTVIERTGAELSLIITDGFRDLLNIQRLRLDKAVDLFNLRAVPLIPRERVFPVSERLDAFGRVVMPLDTGALEEIGQEIVKRGVREVVVCFLHSYRNPVHEKKAVAALRKAHPELLITASSDIWPQQSEYERATVAILNAYVRNKISSYIGEIEAYLQRNFDNAKLYITRSNGGLMSAKEAGALPVLTMLSGPASGVSAGIHVAKWRHEPALLTMDMGGTSTDVSLVLGTEPLISTRSAVGDFPLYMPVTGIEAIGAGGGSIAAMDGPVLTVGPTSAGAVPGPACYDRLGTQATLTDAYLLCGYIDPDTFLGGRMPLNPSLARKAIEAVANGIGSDVWGAAEACVNVATSNMVAKVLPFLARMAADPRDITLLAYGGAGPIHGCLLAEEIGIDRVLVPATPSVFCAYGGIVAPLMHDVNRTIQGEEMSMQTLRSAFGGLLDGAKRWLAEQIEEDQLVDQAFQLFLEARYIGQAFSVTVQVPEEMIRKSKLDDVFSLFHAEHLRLYTHCDEEAPVEFVEARVRVVGKMRAPQGRLNVMQRDGVGTGSSGGKRRCRFAGTWHDTAVLRPVDLERHPVAGPAVVECGDTTVLVPPGFRASAEDGAFIEIRRENQAT